MFDCATEQVVVRTTVVITLCSLAAAFAVLFLHNWRLWEQNMPGPTMKGNKLISESEEDTDTEDMYQVSLVRSGHWSHYSLCSLTRRLIPC